jgi:hypothetical protein
MLGENEKLCIAGVFHTDNQSYHINGKNETWGDGFKIKGSIRTDQLPTKTQYNAQHAVRDGIYYRIRGEMTIDQYGITFTPPGEQRSIRIYNHQLPPDGLDFIEEDNYHQTIYRGKYKPISS